jgi:hypothetical protein
MTRVAWFNAELAGISGDMALAALLDAGADPSEVRALLDQLGVTGWALERQPVLGGGLAASRAVVDAPDAVDHRCWRDIRDLLTAAALPDRVRDRALAVFAALADAESRLHGVPPEDVHFHEVGALDALVDIVGVCAALEVLGIDQVRCSPLAQGRGVVAAAHGVLPVPAPAVVQLLADVGAPTVGVDVEAELTTPTGAALMTALAGPGGFGPLPALVVTATGFGAGSRDLPDRPNLTQVVIGRLSEAAVVIETNVDDVTGEVLAHAIARLLAAGAQDAWATPIVMKKGRPAHTVHAIADLDEADVVTEVLLAETGSLGARTIPVGKRRTTWSVRQLDVDGHPVRVKVGPTRVKAEHDDAARAAVALGLPLRTVLARAEEGAKRCI